MSAQELIGQELIQLQHSMPILDILYLLFFPTCLSSLSSPSPAQISLTCLWAIYMEWEGFYAVNL